MKHISALLIILFASALTAQNPFHDAKKIASGLDSKNQFGPKHLPILYKYFPDKSDNEIAVELSKNPFIKDYFNPASLASIEAGGIDEKIFGSTLGGIDVTNFVNALSEIMIERANQELTVSFFNKFKKFVREHEEFALLFPRTAANLENMLFYKYNEMLPTLRTGFFDDIKQMHYRLDDVLMMPKYENILKDLPEIKIAINTLGLVHDLESGASNAADVIKDFAAFKEWNAQNAATQTKNMGNSLKLAAVFSESFRSTTADSIWVSPKDVRKLMINKPGFDIYLGLIYQQCRKIEFITTTRTASFAALMAENRDRMELWRNKTSEFMALANSVNDNFKNLQDKLNNDKGVTNDDIYNYVNVSIDIIDFSSGISQMFYDRIDTGKYISITRNCNSLYKDIYSKQYNQAVTRVFDIFYELNTLLENRAGQDKAKQKENGKFLDYIEEARPYALLMANMVNAKSEEEIKTALESAILPVGSSSIKKYSYFNLAFQSYLGARFTTGNIKPIASSWSDEFGVSAPVGVGFSYGMKRSGSITLFVPLIDLGAIVDYKLTTSSNEDTGETTVQKDYKIELGQIFSPGAYLVYGLPWNIPLSIGFGGQYGPGLSKIAANSDVQVENPYWRWSAFLSVDIPLFNLLNFPKSSKLPN